MSTVVPMFPLPGVFLFPGQVMPLHVFEPRYRQMIDDLLDAPGRFVVATLVEPDTADDATAPPVLPVAGLGEIAGHQRLDDGRFLVLLIGLGRVHIEEVPTQRMYRRVRVLSWPERPASAADEQQLKGPLVAAIRARTGFQGDRLESASTGQLADVLAQCLAIPQQRMATIFSEPEAAHRARRVLAEYGDLDG